MEEIKASSGNSGAVIDQDSGHLAPLRFHVSQSVSVADHTEYAISVMEGRSVWTVQYRYSSILDFHHKIKRGFPKIKMPRFPRRSPFADNSGQAFIAARRHDLHEYMQKIASLRRPHPELFEAPFFLEFFKLDDAGSGGGRRRSDAGGNESAADVFRAIANGNDQEFSDLLKAKPGFMSSEEPVTKRSPIHLAALHRRIKMCSYLILHGADVNKTDSLGFSPLHLAAMSGDSQVLLLFIYVEDVVKSAVTKDGSTVLHYFAANFHGVGGVAANSSGGGVTSLPSSPSNTMHSTTTTTVTPTHDRQLQQRPESVLRHIFDKVFEGIDVEVVPFVNTRNNAGDSALHVAAQKVNPLAIALLLERGALVDVLNNAGESPLSIAASSNNKRAIVLLLSRGANIYIGPVGKTPVSNPKVTTLLRKMEEGKKWNFMLTEEELQQKHEREAALRRAHAQAVKAAAAAAAAQAADKAAKAAAASAAAQAAGNTDGDDVKSKAVAASVLLLKGAVDITETMTLGPLRAVGAVKKKPPSNRAPVGLADLHTGVHHHGQPLFLPGTTPKTIVVQELADTGALPIDDVLSLSSRFAIADLESVVAEIEALDDLLDDDLGLDELQAQLSDLDLSDSD
eukprot:TRINITY_DN5069_c0_g1_i3.p1 TRINITY_DN5069_c0_g1~~TRINITY_DN5069_c0_g1_i3.p1  ORF type:complete len:624 (+),score=133.97 TRINITY_DN5069_c0_g1_i3:318-2189(+)